MKNTFTKGRDHKKQPTKHMKALERAKEKFCSTAYRGPGLLDCGLTMIINGQRRYTKCEFIF